MEIFNITWASPQFLMPFIILLIGIVIGLVFRYRKSMRIATQLVHQKWHDILLKNFSQNKKIIKALLTLAGIVGIMLALLQPQWHKKDQSIQQEGRDLFVALDISRSMLAQDIAPSRLQRAKEKIHELLDHIPCERVGLMVFSGSAFVHCPLTTDFVSFSRFLDHIDTKSIGTGTTSLESVIAKALDTFERIPNKKNKLLVIVTDGEDYSHNLKALKEQAQQQSLRIFTLGIGTPQGAPIPLYDEHTRQQGYLKDDGKVVITRLNEGILSSLAHDVGGVYIKVTDDDTDLKTVASWVARFEKERFDDKKISLYDEQYPWFIALGFICFALEWLL